MKSKEEQSVALERIKVLFAEAEKASDLKLSNDYVAMARKIAMKYNVKIPPALKRKFCKHCNCYFKPGVNLRVRTNKGKVVFYCSSCKKFTRIPYTKDKKKN